MTLVHAGATASTAIERMAHDLLDLAPDDRATTELIAWLAGSPRFRAFVEANAPKIRKKFRNARDDELRRDVRAELLAARLLLSDRRFELAYEAYGSTGGPDFTVTFRASRTFNVEVTRLRRAPDRADYGAPIVAKLRQLPPSVPNLLVIAVDGDTADTLDAGSAVRALRARAEARDDAFFAARGLSGARAFHDRMQRLGAIIAWADGATGDPRAAPWANANARIPLPKRSAAACLACFRAGLQDA